MREPLRGSIFNRVPSCISLGHSGGSLCGGSNSRNKLVHFMKIDRRQLIVGAGAAALMRHDPAKARFPHGSVNGGAPTGRVMFEFPAMSSSAAWFVTNQAKMMDQHFVDGNTTDDCYSFLDSNGYPNGTGAGVGAGNWGAGIRAYVSPDTGVPYTRTTWVLNWSPYTTTGSYQNQVGIGGASPGLLFSLSLGGIEPGRNEFYIDYDPSTPVWNNSTGYLGQTHAVIASDGTYWLCVTSNGPGTSYPRPVDPLSDTTSTFWTQITTGWGPTNHFSITIKTYDGSAAVTPYAQDIQFYLKKYETQGLVGTCNKAIISNGSGGAGNILDTTAVGASIFGAFKVGQWVFGPGVPWKTLITHDNGNGTYQLSKSASVLSPTRITAEPLFDPHFLSSVYAGGFGRARFVQSDGGIASITSKWEDRQQITNAGWSVYPFLINNYIGRVTIGSDNTIVGTKPSGMTATSWTQGQSVEMRWTNRPTIFTVTAFSPVGDGIHSALTVPGHTYNDGDLVTFYGQSSTVPTAPTWSSGTNYYRGSAVQDSSGYVWISNTGTGASPNIGNDPNLDDGTNWYGLANGYQNASFAYSLMGSGVKGNPHAAYYTVSSANQRAGTFQIDADCSNWGTYNGSSAKVYKAVTIAVGTGSRSLPPKILMDYAGGVWGFSASQPITLGDMYVATYDSTLDGLCFTQTVYNVLPVELMVEMGNALNVDPWINLPQMATLPADVGNDGSDYATQLATLVKSELNSNLRCYYEYCNEVWNGSGGYLGTGYCKNLAVIKYGNALGIFTQNHWKYANYLYPEYGVKVYQSMSAISAVYSGNLSACYRVMAMFTAIPGWASGSTNFGVGQWRDDGDIAITGIASHPITVCDGIAIAPYLDIKSGSASFTGFISGTTLTVMSLSGAINGGFILDAPNLTPYTYISGYPNQGGTLPVIVGAYTVGTDLYASGGSNFSIGQYVTGSDGTNSIPNGTYIVSGTYPHWTMSAAATPGDMNAAHLSSVRVQGSKTWTVDNLQTLGSASSPVAFTAGNVSYGQIYDYLYGSPTDQANALQGIDNSLRYGTGAGYALGDLVHNFSGSGIGLYDSWKNFVAKENAAYGTNVELINYEGSLGFEVVGSGTIWNSGYIAGSNPYTGSAGTKTLYSVDLQVLCAAYYQSTLAAAALADNIRNYISSSSGVTGKKFSAFSLTTAPYNWSGAMFGYIQGNEYRPNTPAITEIKKFNDTGVP
jgi:hypothetical protein